MTDKYANKSRYIDNGNTKTHKPQRITELRFHKNITEHDLNIKLRKAEEALLKKHQVKIKLQLIGRERSHPEQGVSWLNEIVEKFEKISTSNRQPTPDNLVVILFPKK